MRKLSKWDKLKIQILEETIGLLKFTISYAGAESTCYRGICPAINRAGKFRTLEDRDFFMDLVGLKPPRNYDGGRFWWTLDKGGYKKRVRAIRAAIKRIEGTIENGKTKAKR